MNDLYKRFINKRIFSILFIVMVAAFYVYLDSGLQPGNVSTEVYEQVTLHTDKSCDVMSEYCKSASDAVNVELQLLGAPGALKPFPVAVKINGLKQSADARVIISFEMKGMDMGQIKHKLIRQDDSSDWGANVVLPLCTSGRSDWSANIEVIENKKIYLAEFAFELNKVP